MNRQVPTFHASACQLYCILEHTDVMHTLQVPPEGDGAKEETEAGEDDVEFIRRRSHGK